MEALSLLTEFGLTRQEATLYLCLLAEGDQNGYELAKKTGISRSNAYTGLAGLVDKGAAWTIEGENVRYRAVPGTEFTGNKLSHWAELQRQLIPLLPVPHEKAGSYVTVRGRTAIVDRMRNLVADARERVYLSLNHELLDPLVAELKSLCERGCKLVVLSDDAGCSFMRKACSGVTLHRSEPVTGQIRLIVDSQHVLTGELNETGESSCLYSNHHNLVELFKSSMKNEIRLARFENRDRRK
jgi:sugar-specific transcriptional regulator TrmB